MNWIKKLKSKFIIFTDGGYPPPIRGKFRKIINLIFEPFPNR